MKRGSGPRNVNLVHGAEALDVLNQPAKSRGGFHFPGLPGKADYFLSAAGLLMPLRKDQPPP
jgi:hypothetical protein